jgi:hypothetical protein
MDLLGESRNPFLIQQGDVPSHSAWRNAEAVRSASEEPLEILRDVELLTKQMRRPDNLSGWRAGRKSGRWRLTKKEELGVHFGKTRLTQYPKRRAPLTARITKVDNLSGRAA